MRKILPKFRFRHEYFIFLLPLFFVFHGYNTYGQSISTGELLLLVLRYLTLVFFVSILIFFLLGSFRKASVLSFVFFCFYFYYGAAYDWLLSVQKAPFLLKYRFIVPLFAALFICLFIYLKKSWRTFNRLTAYLNLLLIVLLVFEAIMMVKNKRPVDELIFKATDDNAVSTILKPCDTCVKEDIHLIIVDEYAGQQQLNQIFNFDNSAFLDSLRLRGFHINTRSVSNYNYTEISIASMLSMDYLGNLGQRTENELYKVGTSVISNNAFTRFLTSQGYAVHNFSIFDIKGQPPYNKHFHPPIEYITHSTLFSRMEAEVDFLLVQKLKCDFALSRVTQILERESRQNSRTIEAHLKAIRVQDPLRPHFYYTHLLLPHKPYLFDKSGKFIGIQQHFHPGTGESDKVAYTDYLQYGNSVLLSYMDSLIEKSSRPPVIILMSDHGYRDKAVPKSAQFFTLNAVYFPDKRYNGFYDTLSNVNQLRILLNNRLGQQLPLLKDSSIFLKDFGL